MEYKFDNYNWFNFLLKRLYLYLISFSIGITIILSFLVIYLGLKIVRLSKQDNVYVICGNDIKEAVKRKAPTLWRDKNEIMIFSRFLLERIFSNHEYSLEENLEEIIHYMDEKSAKLLISKLNEDIRLLYKVHNGISTVKIKELEMSLEKSPIEVYLSYEVNFRFPNSESVLEDMNTSSGVYFEIEPIKRCKANPYDIQIRSLTFVSNQQKNEDTK
ncbi:MAG: hypothetical protein GY830_08555 [Bacteroidetes bacterium]|nr:hypothetical protein [Bacteroidota bacterium]